MIRIISLEGAFADFRVNLIKRFDNVDEVLNYIHSVKKSHYEILSGYTKPYFDIENVDKDDIIHGLVEEIIQKFNKVFECKVSGYVLTRNEHSTNHKGLSYHLILSGVKLYNGYLKTFVNREFPDNQYIDNSVYNSNRLFRTIESYAIGKVTPEKNYESVHRIFDGVIYGEPPKTITDKDCEKDFERMTIISDITGCKEVTIGKDFIEPLKCGPKKTRKTNVSMNMVGTLIEKLDLIQSQIIDMKSPNETDKDENEDEALYNKAIVLLELDVKDSSKTKLKELVEYYQSHKSFKDFRMNHKQIKYLLELIERQV